MNPSLHYLAAIETEMRRAVTLEPGSPSLLQGMLRYHLGWVDSRFQPAALDGGKRIRPVLVCLACESQGGDWETALPAAAAVELLHNFTLIHDDIEDRDELRRGRPTLWALYGVPQAINAGDTLYTLAYGALLGLQRRGVPAPAVLDALAAYTAAVVQITEGQCRDIAFESESAVTEAEYLSMIAGKTAALLGLCCSLGAIVAGAPPAVRNALQRFGESLGLAFQMEDDLLGLWGDPRITGKPAGSDLLRGKKSLPILHGLQHSAELRAMVTQQSLTPDQVAEALRLLEESGSRAYVQAHAGAYHEAAMTALAESGGQGEAQEALAVLAESLIGRAR